MLGRSKQRRREADIYDWLAKTQAEIDGMGVNYRQSAGQYAIELEELGKMRDEYREEFDRRLELLGAYELRLRRLERAISATLSAEIARAGLRVGP